MKFQKKSWNIKVIKSKEFKTVKFKIVKSKELLYVYKDFDTMLMLCIEAKEKTIFDKIGKYLILSDNISVTLKKKLKEIIEYRK